VLCLSSISPGYRLWIGALRSQKGQEETASKEKNAAKESKRVKDDIKSLVCFVVTLNVA
jgi:hypothetical protein